MGKRNKIWAVVGMCALTIIACLFKWLATDAHHSVEVKNSETLGKVPLSQQPHAPRAESGNAKPNTEKEKQLEYPPDRIVKEQAQWDEERRQLGMPIERVPIVEIEMNHIAGAIYHYHQMFKTYPGGTNAEIAKLLLGENSEKLPILAWRQRNLNEGGELLDPWGTPYQIKATDKQIEVRSAGPNRIFWDADDSVAK